MDLTEAYRECERITWSQARNFAYGIRLLPPAKRRGLAVIYAFARRIDDIGDGTLSPEQKIADLEAARQAVLNLDGNSVDGGGHDDPVLLALADTERNFPVPMEAFGELIDGCVVDVRGTHYETFEDLHYYCRCVAGSIGRLSLGVFGTSHDPDEAARLADALGVALQLTNILRDILEDHQNGRIYLPAEDRPSSSRLCRPRSGAARPGRVQPPGGIRGRTGPRVVRHRLAAAADARPAQRGLHRCHGRHLPAPARAHRGAARRRPEQPGFLADVGESHGRGARPGGKRSDEFKVAVIGGGLAGITAALALAESGADVTLLEAGPGSAALTWSFSRDGLSVDNGQHVFLRCCTAYRGLLARLGMTEHATLQDRSRRARPRPGRRRPAG